MTAVFGSSIRVGPKAGTELAMTGNHALAVRSTSSVGMPQVPLRTVSTRVPGLRPVRTSDTSRPSDASRARPNDAGAYLARVALRLFK